jgi:hypothetical protein
LPLSFSKDSPNVSQSRESASCDLDLSRNGWLRKVNFRIRIFSDSLLIKKMSRFAKAYNTVFYVRVAERSQLLPSLFNLCDKQVNPTLMV